MPEQLPFTAFLNRIFGGAANALLNALHVDHNAAAPIANYVAMEILVVVILLLVFALLRASLSVESPGGLQHMFEGIRGFVNDQGESVIGHGSERFTPFVAPLFIFILIANLLGLVPAFESPTGVPYVPFGLTLIVFFFYHFVGLQKHGIAYLKQFLGPVPALAPLMVVVEICSHLARVLSLTVRLFANMFAGDMVTLVIFSMIPLGLPVLFLGLHVAVSFLQAYIFMLLTMVYLGGAVSSEH